MTPRRWVSLGLVVVVEVYLYVRYAELGAQFHFWLHGLFGAALGLAALTLLRLLRRRTRGSVPPWEAGWLGHMYSAVPDVLFLGFGVLHMLWMDVFAVHITLHFVRWPLATMWVLFALTLLAYGLAMAARRGAALGVLAVSGGLTLVALAGAGDVPSTVDQVRGHDGLALLCPVMTHVA